LIGGSTPEGKEKYNSWVVHDSRNIVQILEDLPTCKPNLDHLCELLPRLQARYYSISSSPKVHPTSIHVTAALVKYDTPTGRTNKGVATNWLLELAKKIVIGEEPQYPIIPIFVRKSQFR
jgi:NADPH-ferrihemoprotein reductase